MNSPEAAGPVVADSARASQADVPFADTKAAVLEIEPVAASSDESVAPSVGDIHIADAPLPSADVEQAAGPAVYHSAAYDRAAQGILGAIGRRERFMLLTAEAGMGKTTLCRAVMDQVDSRTFTMLVTTPLETINGLLKNVLRNFGVLSSSPARAFAPAMTQHELRVALRNFLRSIDYLTARAVLFVDDAENLSLDMLQQVAALADVERGLLAIVLVGRPSVLTMLNQRGLKSLARRLTVRCELGPIGREEIAEYIEYRADTKSQRRMTFDVEALDALYSVSRGVPLLVDQICERLRAYFESSLNSIGSTAVDAVARDLDLIPAPAAPVKRRRRWLFLTLSLVLLILAGAGAAAWYFRAQLPELLMRVRLR